MTPPIKGLSITSSLTPALLALSPSPSHCRPPRRRIIACGAFHPAPPPRRRRHRQAPSSRTAAAAAAMAPSSCCYRRSYLPRSRSALHPLPMDLSITRPIGVGLISMASYEGRSSKKDC
ncbi:hypothetical protein NL676_038613 [Syzygium grande]|nr:hypothetical protein NL676_038613 [Syzygium grande]